MRTKSVAATETMILSLKARGILGCWFYLDS